MAMRIRRRKSRPLCLLLFVQDRGREEGIIHWVKSGVRKERSERLHKVSETKSDRGDHGTDGTVEICIMANLLRRTVVLLGGSLIHEKCGKFEGKEIRLEKQSNPTNRLGLRICNLVVSRLVKLSDLLLFEHGLDSVNLPA